MRGVDDSHRGSSLILSGGKTLQRLGKTVCDLIYPPSIYCPACGNLTDSTRTYGLCDECAESFEWNTGRTCRLCGKALIEELVEIKTDIVPDTQDIISGSERSDNEPILDFPRSVPKSMCLTKRQENSSKYFTLCHDCRDKGRAFTRGISCVSYAGQVKAMIRDMKYHNAHIKPPSERITLATASSISV